MTIPCSLRGINIEALHNPTVRTSVMSEFLAKNLLGNMPLVPTDKLFKSPLGLFFECCGIARAMPIIIEKIKVFIDFHIFAILEFNLLIGYPVENLFKEKPFLGSHDEKLGKLLLPFLSFAPKVPWRSTIPTMTRSRRQSSFSRSFHLGFQVKLNDHRHPYSNPSHILLAIQMLFSMVKIQR
jgi:hypothetical protein